MSDLTLLVLAAGMGSRFGGLKQMDDFGPNGETIIDYSVYDAIKAGFSKVVFVIREDFKTEFEDQVVSKFKDRIEVSTVFQNVHELPAGLDIKVNREKPWGTGHAVWVARNEIQTAFAVINADDFYGRDSYELMASYLKDLDIKDNGKHILLAFQLDKTLSDFGPVSRGICNVDGEKNLDEIREYKSISKEKDEIIAYYEGEKRILTGKEIVSMNMMGFSPAVFESLEKDMAAFISEHLSDPKAEYYLPILLNHLIQSGTSKIKVPASPSEWFGVTYKEDKAWVVNSIAALIEENIYPEKLWDS